MSKEDFDRDWKPNGRPQSTMAKSFSLALDDLFKIDDSLADLDAKVYEKKKVVSTQTSELEALEARLKATEERLKMAATNPPANNSSSGRSSPRSRPPIGSTFSQSSPPKQPTSPLGTEFEPKSPTRPPTAGNKGAARPSPARLQRESSYKVPPMPGALPPTPGASEGEYVLVATDRTSADYVVVDEDGDASPAIPSRHPARAAEE